METLFAFSSHLVLFLSLTTLIFALSAYLTFMLRRRRPSSIPARRDYAGHGALLRRYGGDHE